jgi:hypothetical protein
VDQFGSSHRSRGCAAECTGSGWQLGVTRAGDGAGRNNKKRNDESREYTVWILHRIFDGLWIFMVIHVGKPLK